MDHTSLKAPGKQVRTIQICVKRLVDHKGRQIDFNPGDVVLVVGPNNGGKSTLLNEIIGRLQTNQDLPQRIFKSIALSINVTLEGLISWLETVGRRTQTDSVHGILYYMRGGANWSNELFKTLDQQQQLSGLFNFAVRFLRTEDRTRLVEAKPMQQVESPPQNSMQQLLSEEEIERKLRRVVKEAFGRSIVLERGYGQQTYLHFGDPPAVPEGKDRLSREYQTAVHALEDIQSQGDGVKAFTGILLEIMAGDAFVVAIDEPETFLHPPQVRRLARNLVEELPDDTQLFIATHSADVVRGLLNTDSARIRVLRISRDTDGTTLTEVPQGNITDLWRDPTLRVSSALEGLFHERVIVCEGDTDCRFYAAILEGLRGESVRTPDCAFVHGGGKGKAPTIIEALSAVKVPVAAIFDLDVLNDIPTLKRAVLALQGDWASLSDDIKTLTNAVATLKAESSAQYIRQQIAAQLDAIAGDSLSPTIRLEIERLLRGSSPWSLLKKSGIKAIPSGGPTLAFQRLDKGLRSLGIFLVSEGEVEGFYRKAGDRDWISKALAEPIATSPDLAAARDFVSRVSGQAPI